eukprot:SAG11_NODE_25069_length_364_cov_0.747170_1_plen_50_part_10
MLAWNTGSSVYVWVSRQLTFLSVQYRFQNTDSMSQYAGMVNARIFNGARA